jgi:hypothetical protein
VCTGSTLSLACVAASLRTTSRLAVVQEVPADGVLQLDPDRRDAEWSRRRDGRVSDPGQELG